MRCDILQAVLDCSKRLRLSAHFRARSCCRLLSLTAFSFELAVKFVLFDRLAFRKIFRLQIGPRQEEVHATSPGLRVAYSLVLPMHRNGGALVMQSANQVRETDKQCHINNFFTLEEDAVQKFDPLKDNRQHYVVAIGWRR